MFTINGPSGPTTRCERRVATDAERQQRETARRLDAKQKGESFFIVRKTTPPRAALAANGKPTSATSASSASTTDAVDRTDAPESTTKNGTETQIFKGCRIILNGRTGNISSYYLAKLVQDHGGNVCSALTATRVTHMVGANLSGSKADRVLKTAGKIKIVNPDWILQSVKHQKRQSEFEYLLYKDKQQLRLT